MLNAGGIICTEAMLKHERFLLTPDISGNSWILYSETKYLLLEQRLLQYMAKQPDFNPNNRVSRILLGNAIELTRERTLLPLNAEQRNWLGIEQIQLSPD